MEIQEPVKINSLGLKGDGVGALADGRRVYVPYALPGETVRVAVTGETPHGITARLLGYENESAERAVPPCAHFGTCGGCTLQHVKDAVYRRFKTERVLEALQREGLAAGKIDEIHVSPPGSRRRATFAARCDENGRVTLGFNERASHSLVSIRECAVLRPALVTLLPLLHGLLLDIMLPGEHYDIAVAEADGCIDLLITALGEEGRRIDAETEAALRSFAQAQGIARISWRAQPLQPARVIAGKNAYTVDFCGVRVTPPPGAFLQATAEGEQALTDFAMHALKKSKYVADLYAGCGTFAFAALQGGARVDAFEGAAAAIEALSQAGKGNAKLKAAQRNLARMPLTFQELKVYDGVIIDPPRIGAQKQMEEISKSSVSTVVSISCNPDSFASDGKILVQKGFALKRLRVVDQFLWSPHVEVAGLFSRKARR